MKTYWEVLLGVVLWIALIVGAIVAVVWFTTLWQYTPLVLVGLAFAMLVAFAIWVDQ